MECVVDQQLLSHDLHLMLIGKTGSGVSASGNTILGENVFPSRRSLTSITDRCEKHTAKVSNKSITVLDTPNFFHSKDINLSVKLKEGLSLCSPELHAILLVIRLDTFTQQDIEVVSLYKQMFGKKVMKYTFVLFTHGDELKKKTADLIRENAELSKLTKECGGRFHLLNNKDLTNRDQVTKLLLMIEQMVSENQNRCYTLQMFETQSLKLFFLLILLRFMKPEYLLSVVIIIGLGCVNMKNEGSYDVKTFVRGCAGGVLAAVAGAASGAVCTLICKNHRWTISRLTEVHLNNVKLLGIICGCGCAVGVMSGYLVGARGLLDTLLRGIQGAVVAYTIPKYHFR